MIPPCQAELLNFEKLGHCQTRNSLGLPYQVSLTIQIIIRFVDGLAALIDNRGESEVQATKGVLHRRTED
jgi:hypothetical protein